MRDQNGMTVMPEKMGCLLGEDVCRQNGHFLSYEIATRMYERVSVINSFPQRILDARVASNDNALLEVSFPKEQRLDKDTVPGRREERGSYADRKMGRQCVYGRLEQLPFHQSVFDMIWSNLALHWYGNIAAIFEEWERVLVPDGFVMFSCFGKDTLSALHGACHEMGEYGKALSFPDMRDIGDGLIKAGFVAPVVEKESIVVTYTDIRKLLQDLRMPCGNFLVARSRGLSGRRRYERFCEAVMKRRTEDGLLALNFDVIYAHAFKPRRGEGMEKAIHLYRS